MTRKISLGGALKAATKAVNKTKVRPAKAKAKAGNAERKAAPEAPKERAADHGLHTDFGVKMCKAFRKAVGKPLTALSASISASTAKVTEGGVSLQALNKMAHVGKVHWGDAPSIDAKALANGKVQFTPAGVARYTSAFNATK